MKNRHAVLWCLILQMFIKLDPASADEWSVAYLSTLLREVPAEQRTVQLGDMEILVANLQTWRDELAGVPHPNAAFTGNAPLWTNGKVYYSFDAGVTAAKQRAFLDGAAEWAMFASLQFIVRTTQANYMLVKENPGLGGGQSAVGMVGGEQIIQFGPSAWNRATICHELGHALGMVHEHQRSDRDSFVQVFTNNVAAGQLGNFVKLANSINLTAYDFLSVMHYSTNSFSIDAANLNTLYPLPAYASSAPLMGEKFDPVLSTLDRAAMASKYGPGPALAAVVTNTADGGPGTLRAALYYAFDHPGTTITFNIPASDSGYSNGVFNILPTDGLPSLVNATTIDGASQPNDSNPNGPEIFLNGSLILPYTHGLRLSGTNCIARGLTISGFPGAGVLLRGTDSKSNTVAGCYLGVDPTGTTALPNGYYPVEISTGATGNRIGGASPSDRNVISGSIYQGVVIHDSGTRSNTVLGNYIGLNAAGTQAISNAWAGVSIFGGAQFNRVGGFAENAFNVISGNGHQGVSLSETGTTGNVIDGNYIGLNPAGTTAIPNGWSGVEMFGGAVANRVGGFDPGAHNAISGNPNYGVVFSGSGTDGNGAYGNIIGLNAASSAAVPNSWAGVAIYGGAKSNTIGLTGAGNTICGNANQGVAISGAGTRGNLVAGNFIGMTPAGMTLGNQWAGVVIYDSAQSNLVGGTLSSGRNLISGNGNQGVALFNANTRGNVISGNFIGVNATGTAAAGNAWAGVGFYTGPDSNQIGGTSPGTGNVISGNGNQGVALVNTATHDNAIQGNLIGLNASGTAAISNSWSGVEIASATGNLVGGTAGARNVISGNANYGVSINGSTSGTLLLGNTIGFNSANNAALPNGYGGVVIFAGAVSNQVGGVASGEANLIAGNSSDGVRVDGSGSTNNTVRGNSIFNNTGAGISVTSSANRSIAPPTLSSAVLTTSTTVGGNYTGTANATYQLDFYADAAPAASAEGRTHLGARSLTTSAGGNANFSFSLPALVPAGRIITANATDAAGNSSRLATGITVTLASTPNDQIPDQWRAQYFGGSGTATNAQSCATCDPDHDGASNRAEFFAGTNPTNAASVLRLTALQPKGSGDVASFSSVTGVIYQIEAREALNAGPWSVLAYQIAGTGDTVGVNDPTAMTSPNRLYRVAVSW